MEQEQKLSDMQLLVTDETPVEPIWPPPPRPLPRQQPTEMIRILTLIIAVLLVVSGLSAIIAATTNQYGLTVGLQRRLNTNATVRSQVASQATQVSALDATAQTLATTQAGIYASATAQDQSTAIAQEQATATATIFGGQLTQATSGTPVLNDPLSDNSLNNLWDEVSTVNQDTSCHFDGAAYEAQEGRQGFILPCFANATNFTNFVYQVTMTIVSGDQGGIIFCANKGKKQYYLFRIDTNGNYALELYANNQYALLTQGTDSTILTGAGNSNTLTVLVNKGTLALFVNSVYVGSASDTTLSSGQIGVVAIDRDLPTIVDFSNAEVWNVSS